MPMSQRIAEPGRRIARRLGFACFIGAGASTGVVDVSMGRQAKVYRRLALDEVLPVADMVRLQPVRSCMSP